MPPTKPEVRVNGPLMPHVPQAEAPAPQVSSGSITTGAPVANATFEITKAAVLKAQQASVAATIAAAEANRLQRIEAALIAAGYTEAQINQAATEGVQGIMDLVAALLGK